MAQSLRAFRESLRMTQQEVADTLGIDRSRWKNWEYGYASPPPKIVRELRRMGYGEPSRPIADTLLGRPKIPVGFSLGSMVYAGIVPAGEWGDPLASEEFVEVEVKFEHPKRFAATVVGDSCYPALQQGDMAIWHHDLNPPYGSIVLAQRKGDHGCTVKELAYSEGRPMLLPVNPNLDCPPDGDGWGVIARLVGVIRKVDGMERTWYLDSGLRAHHLTV